VTGRPVPWRARWAFAQITGVLFSTAVWVVLLAVVPGFVVALMLGGVVFLAAFRTRPVLWLVFGARRATATERDAVLRSIVPVASLRGRNQPQVFVGTGHRAATWPLQAPGHRHLLVSESLRAQIRAGAISDLTVSAMVAHMFGQVPAIGSRTVLAVEMYCLPWSIIELVAARITPRLARVPLMSLSWRLRPVAFGLGLTDAVLHARWEAAVPLVAVSVLTYTTGPLRRAWQRRLAELGDRRVDGEGLGSRSVLDQATWVVDVVRSEGVPR